MCIRTAEKRPATIKSWLSLPLEFANDVRIVAAWDMVRQARRPFLFVTRMMLAGLISFQVVWMWSTLFPWGEKALRRGNWELMPVAITTMIQSIYQTSNFIVSVGIILLCPVLTAGCVAGDRERKIWYDLVNSPLPGGAIVLGKLLSRLATIVAWILVLLPVWAILGLMGGLDPGLVLVSVVAFFFYGWFYASVGLLASVLTPRTRDALGLASSLVVLLIFMPFLDDAIRLILFDGQILWLVEDACNFSVIFNPVLTLSYEIPMSGLSTGISSFLQNRFCIAIVMFSGPALTLISGLLVRPVSRRLESRTLSMTTWPYGQLITIKHSDVFEPSDGDSFLANSWNAPLAIKERKTRLGSRLVSLLKTLLLITGGFIGGYFLATSGFAAFREMLQYGYDSPHHQNRDVFMRTLMAITCLIHLPLLCMLTLDTAGRLVTEKESDTWLTLLSTPVETREILQSKVIGALWSWRVTIGFLVMAWWTGCICGAISLFGLMLAFAVWSIQISLALCSGLRFGLTSQNFQSAALKSVSIWLLLEFFIPFLGIFILDELTAGVQPTVIAVGVLAIHEARLSDGALPGILTLGTFTTIMLAFCAYGLYYSISASFDRLNERTLYRPK